MSDARLLHIENLKYSQNCEGVIGAWTEDVDQTVCETRCSDLRDL